MKTRSLIILLGALIPSAAMAQQMSMAQGGSVAAVKSLYEMSKAWITKSAEQMPESSYSFKPTPEVRSFGQLIGHLANSQYEFCGPVRGETGASRTDWEKTSAKADLIKALNEAFAYCDAAFQLPEAKTMEEATFFGGMKNNKLWGLMFEVAHNNEHYGNIVTYMRMKGMVPPSSQGGM